MTTGSALRPLALACATAASACASPPAPCPQAPTVRSPEGAEAPAAPVITPTAKAPSVLHLSRYASHGHRSVEVDVGGTSEPFLFDTGGGISVVAPRLAAHAGCRPSGQLVGYRMRGDDVRFPRCEQLALEVDGAEVPPAAVGVFDVSALLPPKWPRLGGVIALSSFEDRVVSIDLKAGLVTIDLPMSDDADSSPIRTVRQASGFSLIVLVPVESKQGTLWLELDSGSSAPLILAPHAAHALGMEVSTTEGEKSPAGTVSLALPQVGPTTTDAEVADIIYDGNIGAPLMERFRWTLDLARRRVRIEQP